MGKTVLPRRERGNTVLGAQRKALCAVQRTAKP